MVEPMKIAAGLLLTTAAGLLTWWKAKNRGGPSDLFQFFAWTAVFMAALMLCSLLLPQTFAQPAQEVLGWCLAGSTAAIGLGAALRALEGLLEA